MSILIDSTGQSPYKRSFSFCNYVIISCFLLFGFVLTSCDQETYNAKSIMKKHVGDDGYKWYSYEFENKLGICDEEGNVKVLPKYDSIKYVSDGKFYELKEVVDGDTLLVILDKNYKTLVSRDMQITSYKKWETKDVDSRYFYHVDKKNKVGEELSGAFDKNWNPIFYPYFHNYPHIIYRTGSVEKFELYLWKEQKDLYMPLNFKMDKEGNVVKDKDFKKAFVYQYFTKQIDATYWDNYHQTGGIFVGYRTVTFYKDFVVEGKRKFRYQPLVDNSRVYINVEPSNNDYGDFETRFIFDDNNNMTEEYRFINNSRYSSQYDFEILYDNEGIPFLASEMKDYYQAGIDFHDKLYNAYSQSNEATENNELWIRMNNSVRKGFKDKVLKTINAEKEIEKWNTEKMKVLKDYFCQFYPDLKDKLITSTSQRAYSNNDGRKSDNHSQVSSNSGTGMQVFYYPQGGSSSGGSNYNSSINNQTHTQTVNRIPCKNCVNGRMLVERSISVTKFGLEPHMNKCTECGKSYDASEYSHIHQNCTYCKGKGYIE